MTDYPNPAEAIAKSIGFFESGDRDAARYWLAVAAELRAGWRDKEQGYVRSNPAAVMPDADPLGLTVEQRQRSDIAETVQMIVGPRASECPSCGGETFAGELGDWIHRSTYKKECEFATVGR